MKAKPLFGPNRRQESLPALMNRLARSPGRGRLAVRRPSQALVPILSIIDAFAAGDPVLAGLLKQLSQARIQHGRLSASYGPDDPMVLVAADMVGSLQSAVDTRLIELRAQPETRQAAARVMKKSRRQRRQALRTKTAQDNFAATMFIYGMLYEAVQKTSSLKSLAHDFTAASVSEAVAA